MQITPSAVIGNVTARVRGIQWFLDEHLEGVNFNLMNKFTQTELGNTLLEYCIDPCGKYTNRTPVKPIRISMSFFLTLMQKPIQNALNERDREMKR